MGVRDVYISKLYGYGLYGVCRNVGQLIHGARRGVNYDPALRTRPPRVDLAPAEWWARPGLGMMYQIEARPGWSWQRNFERFNASLRAPDGTLRFDGPRPRIAEWVALSSRIGCDYHTFEAKWHDGICYWDTPLTRWKAPIDYCRQFADAGRAAGIPHGYYYSAVFDHNPDFDDIQPVRCATASYLGLRGGKRAAVRQSLAFTQFIRLVFWLMRRQSRTAGIRVTPPAPFFDGFRLNTFAYDPDRYCHYVLAQLDDLCRRYAARVIWTDWFAPTGEALSDEIMAFMEQHHPEVVLTFNTSIIHDVRRAHYLTWEAHGLSSTWQQANTYRRLMRPWELITPAATNWDAPQPKANPVENAQTAALIMAAGGKANFGVAAEMDGSLHPDVVRQLELFGDWLRPRRTLFVDAMPMRYAGRAVPGVRLDAARTVTLGAERAGERLIHVFDLQASRAPRRRPLRIEFAASQWPATKRVVLAPSDRELPVMRNGTTRYVEVPSDAIDPIDTILRVTPGTPAGSAYMT